MVNPKPEYPEISCRETYRLYCYYILLENQSQVKYLLILLAFMVFYITQRRKQC